MFTSAAAGPFYVPPSVSMTTLTGGSLTAPASTTTYKMQGFGALLTPALPPGNVLVNIDATAVWVTSGAVGVGIALQAYYGPMVNGIAAPANAAAIPAAGVALGNITSTQNGVVLTTIGDNLIPISVSVLAKGLAQGQQYWFDLAALSLTTASDCFLQNITVTLVEIG